MKRFRAVIIAAALGSSLLAPHLPLDAQPTHTAARESTIIEVKNVPATLMAYWIDPAHNRMPSALKLTSFRQQSAPQNRGNVSGAAGRGSAADPAFEPFFEGFMSGKGLLPLPAGIDSVKPDIRTNSLLVNGTEQGIVELRKTVERLDKPVQQVEIELSFVEADSTNTGVAATTPKGTAVSVQRYSVGELHKLMADQQTPAQTFRFRAFNNTATRQSTETTEVQELINEAAPGAKLLGQMVTRLDCTVTPTVNQDGTVTVALTPSRSTRLMGDELSETQRVPATQVIDVIANVKDGETLVIGGLRLQQPTSANSKTLNAADNGRELLIAVTPRVLRRVSD
jgi:hypothetical protein